MKKAPTLAIVAAAVVCAALILSSAPTATALAGDGGAGGKQIFLSERCNLCHSVSSAGIKAKAKSESMRGPDLTGASADKDPAWLAGYLRQKVRKDGELHKRGFKGSDEELQALVDWLLEQK